MLLDWLAAPCQNAEQMLLLLYSIGTILLSAIGMGAIGVAVHASLRVPDDLFLDSDVESQQVCTS